MVSNASDDFPEPDRPVKTISSSRGSRTSTSLRLCSRAPRIVRSVLVVGSATGSSYRPVAGYERMFGVGGGAQAGGRTVAYVTTAMVARPLHLPGGSEISARYSTDPIPRPGELPSPACPAMGR